MIRFLRYTISGCLGAFVGWLIFEPWHNHFGDTRDFLLLYGVSFGITFFIIIEKFFFAQRDHEQIFIWIKSVVKRMELYLIPLIGVFIVKCLLALLFPIEIPLPEKDENTEIRFLILDVSGSMEGSPLRELKKSVKNYLEVHRDIKSDDEIGCITFSDSSKMLFKPQTNYDQMIISLNSLRSGGETYMAPALRMAIDYLESQPESLNKEIILLSDGVPNKPNNVMSVIRTCTDISIHTIGVGGDYDKSLLSLISTQTKGKFFPADNVTQLSGVFSNIARQGLTQSATDIETLCIIPFWQRLLGWAVCGLLIGLTIGIVNDRHEMIYIGSIGGFIGGSASSMIFIIIDILKLSSATLTRLVSFSTLGFCIGFTIYLFDYLYSRIMRVHQFDSRKISDILQK